MECRLFSVKGRVQGVWFRESTRREALALALPQIPDTVTVSATDTLLHVWRKRTKYLRHQIEALNVLDPEGLLAVDALAGVGPAPECVADAKRLRKVLKHGGPPAGWASPWRVRPAITSLKMTSRA